MNNGYWKKTKIVATIGPASQDRATLEAMISAGVDVCRLNFSHGSQTEHLGRINLIREIFAEKGLLAAIMIDTRGPEIRTHEFQGGRVRLIKNTEVTIFMEEIVGNETQFSVNYPNLVNDVEIGSIIKVDDGILALEVIGLDYQARTIKTKVLNSHTVSGRRGVNVPFAKLTLPFVSEKDRRDIEFGCEHDVSYVAASFVRNAADVLEIKEIIRRKGKEHIVQVIAKIENHEGVENIDAILAVADGIMVARGDLGVELPPEDVPVIQKKIINACFRAGKPSITATQMLDSMQRNPTPTRAEVSDVANAIYDGTDAVMLSGESASGDYPIEAVSMQRAIAGKIEPLLNYKNLADRAYEFSQKTFSDAIGISVSSTASILNAALIIALTGSGATARRISNYRPPCPIIAACDSLPVAEGLGLSWGVYPYLIPDAGIILEEAEQLAIEIARAYHIPKGAAIILVGGTTKGNTDYMKVLTAK